jgi:FkbM family methyltransferase
MKKSDVAGRSNLPLSLFLKSLLVGTRLEQPSLTLRWILNSPHRYRHPELWELFLEERRLPFILQRLLTSHSNVIDVGSHLGSFLSLLVKFAPLGKHIAFEPSKVKSQWLTKRFPRVEIIPSAVANASGTGIFEEDIDRPGYSRLRVKNEAKNTNLKSETDFYAVSVCKLDDLLKRNPYTLVKIDVEGGELAVLQGALGVITLWRPAIIFECGAEYSLRENNDSRRELFDFITQKMDYAIYSYTDFLFNKGSMVFCEFQKCGLYPFRAFNFIALPQSKKISPQFSRENKRLDFRGFRGS